MPSCYLPLQIFQFEVLRFRYFIMMMFYKRLVVLISVLVLPLLVAEAAECEGGGPGCFTREVFDAWANFIGDDKFDSQELWDRMNACSKRISNDEINFWNTVDNFYKGFLEYGIAGGAVDDPWNGEVFVDPTPTPLMSPSNEDRYSLLPSGVSNITIFKPCSMVSDLSFGRSVMAFCEKTDWNLNEETVLALIRSQTNTYHPGQFYHASGTKLGNLTDIEGVNQFAFVVHQGTLQSLPFNPLLHNLGLDDVPFNSTEAAYLSTLIFQNDPISEWYDNFGIFKTTDQGNSFIAFIASVLNIIFKKEKHAQLLTRVLGGALLGGGDFLDFVIDSYTPTLRKAYEAVGVKPCIGTRIRLFSMFLGTFIKVAYAFFFEEEVLDVRHPKRRNFLGALGMRPIAKLGNKLTGFNRRSDPALQKGRHVYPGDRKCNRKESHSKWHEANANAIVDVVLLSDVATKVIDGKRPRHSLFSNHLDTAFVGFTSTAIAPVIERVFNTCFSVFLESFPDPDISLFLQCSVSSIIQNGNTLSDTAADELTETVDMCLVENECIHFDGMQLDVPRMNRCLGLWDQSQPCSSLVNRPRMMLCILRCSRNDAFCASRCLKENAVVSPWLETTSSCLNYLLQENASPEILEECLAAPSSNNLASTSFQTAFVEEMRSLAVTSSADEDDSESVSRLFQALRSFTSCTNRCLRLGADTSFGLPSSLACSVTCAAEL